MKPNIIIIIAGRPNVGKTALLSRIIELLNFDQASS